MDVTSSSGAGSFIHRKGTFYIECVKGWLGPAVDPVTAEKLALGSRIES